MLTAYPLNIILLSVFFTFQLVLCSFSRHALYFFSGTCKTQIQKHIFTWRSHTQTHYSLLLQYSTSKRMKIPLLEHTIQVYNSNYSPVISEKVHLSIVESAVAPCCLNGKSSSVCPCFLRIWILHTVNILIHDSAYFTGSCVPSHQIQSSVSLPVLMVESLWHLIINWIKGGISEARWVLGLVTKNYLWTT